MAEKSKQLTVKEFKMWLEGVEEMQDPSWTPSDTQWKRIREKINQLSEAQAEAPVVIQPPATYPMMPPGMPPVSPGGTVFAPPPVFAPGAGAPPPPGAPFLNDGGAPAKTPNIDTSNGNYKSSFA